LNERRNKANLEAGEVLVLWLQHDFLENAEESRLEEKTGKVEVESDAVQHLHAAAVDVRRVLWEVL
jgi:hypothetical protein